MVHMYIRMDWSFNKGLPVFLWPSSLWDPHVYRQARSCIVYRFSLFCNIDAFWVIKEHGSAVNFTQKLFWSGLWRKERVHEPDVRRGKAKNLVHICHEVTEGGLLSTKS